MILITCVLHEAMRDHWRTQTDACWGMLGLSTALAPQCNILPTRLKPIWENNTKDTKIHITLRTGTVKPDPGELTTISQT